MDSNRAVALTVIPLLLNGLTESCPSIIFDDETSSSDNDDDDDSIDDDEQLIARAASAVTVDHDGGSPRAKRAKVNHRDIETYIPPCIGDTFRQQFRLKKQTSMMLVSLITSKRAGYRTGRPHAAVEQCVLSSLWTLANHESYSSIADRFGMSKGHLHETVRLFCNDMYSMCSEYVKWPKEFEPCSDGFNTLRGDESFPGVIGCVDATHIDITKVRGGTNNYYNDNGSCSIILQAICDTKLCFTDLFVGWPGGASDAQVWKHSPIYKHLELNMLPSDVHLLGDGDYPLMPYLMVPFRDRRNMTMHQKVFNQRLSLARAVIERALGMLKKRFRRLKLLNIYNMEQLPKIVATCCILHNICITENDVELSDMPDVVVGCCDDGTREDSDDELEPLELVAVEKRNQLAQLFHDKL